MGTPMSQLIDAAGGLPEDTGKVIGGGPMMGKALVNTEVPICKGSSGVLIMNDKEAARAEAQPCIRCAKCVSVCPMGLEPFLLATLSAHKDWETSRKRRCNVVHRVRFVPVYMSCLIVRFAGLYPFR